MSEFSEEHFNDYLADLRNKYGQLFFYFQMMERAIEKQDGECMEQFEPEDLVKLNERFVELLKTDPREWKDDRV